MAQTVGHSKIISIDRSRQIGGGRTCKVFVGYYDKQEVAVKRIERDDARFEREADKLRQLKHPNIVHYHYFDSDDDFEYIVMEKCECSLEKYLRDPSIIKKPMDALKIIHDISLGLRFLHSKGGIHRNLHPSNILLVECSGGIVAKIADFGIMKHSPDGSSVSYSGPTGSRRFNNPEELKKEKVSEKSDIFALGLCFYAILTGNKSPYGDDDLSIANAIFKGVHPNLEQIAYMFNGYALHLISCMLQAKEMRPGINEILCHYLFWDADKTMLFLQRASDVAKADRMLGNNLYGAVDDAKWWQTIYRNLDPRSKAIFDDHFRREEQQGRKPIMGGQGLLRQIRNWSHHFSELKPQELQGVLGGSQQVMAARLASTFPRLLPTTYDLFQLKRMENDFQAFYWCEKPPSFNADAVANMYQ